MVHRFGKFTTKKGKARYVEIIRAVSFSPEVMWNEEVNGLECGMQWTRAGWTKLIDSGGLTVQ